MAEQGSQAAVLFADVSGSTKLYETAGDAVAHAGIGRCLESLRKATETGGGRVIKTIGESRVLLGSDWPFPMGAPSAEHDLGHLAQRGQAGRRVAEPHVHARTGPGGREPRERGELGE